MSSHAKGCDREAQIRDINSFIDTMVEGVVYVKGKYKRGTFRIPPKSYEEVVRGDADNIAGCRADVMTILDDARHRMTCPEIIREMGRRSRVDKNRWHCWSERSVKAALADLVSYGHIDNSDQATPRGYGRPVWDRGAA